MTNPNNGGPAYPTTLENEHGVKFTDHGMTLRDYFAGQALAGLLTDLPPVRAASREEGMTSVNFMAHAAYGIADAMITARGGGGTGAASENASDWSSLSLDPDAVTSAVAKSSDRGSR